MTILLAEEVKRVVSEELPVWIEELPDLRLRLRQAIGKIPGETLRPFGYAQDRQAAALLTDVPGFRVTVEPPLLSGDGHAAEGVVTLLE